MTGTVETLFIVFSVISGFCSFTVLLTVFLFPSMRKRGFIQMIIFISLSELVASIFSSFGFPRESSVLCPMQSFFNLFAYKCSWAWTTALCHQLYNVIVEGKYGLSMLQMHLICWLVPLVSTLLPLTTTEYGRDDDSSQPLAWCFLEGKQEKVIVWTSFTLYLVFFVCLVIMSSYLFALMYQFWGVDLKSQHPDVHSIFDAMKLYPLGMAIAWVPNILCSILVNSRAVENTSTFSDIFNSLTILATQDGTITAIIFFLKSKEAQFRWKALLFGLNADEERLTAQFDDDDLYESMTEGSSRASFMDQKVKGSIIKRVNTTTSGTRLDSTHKSSDSSCSDVEIGGWSKFPKTSTSSIRDSTSQISRVISNGSNNSGMSGSSINSKFWELKMEVHGSVLLNCAILCVMFKRSVPNKLCT